MYHRYPYGSFAEYSEECIRGNRRGTSNKRVCSRDIEGQIRKESVCGAKQTRAEIRDYKLSIVNRNCGS